MSSLTERLVQQLLKFRQREAELEQEQKTLEGAEKQRDALGDRLKQLQEQVRKLREIRGVLNNRNRIAGEKYEQARKDDEAVRLQMSDELQAAMEEMNSYAEKIAGMEVKAAQENKMLKGQLEIYTKFREEGQGKFNEIMRSREEEYAKLEAKKREYIARKPQLLAELSEENERFLQVRLEEKELEAKIDEWVARVAELQERLLRAKKCFENFKSEKEKHIKRIRSLETERNTLLARVERSRSERDREQAKAKALEEKVAVHRRQIEKLCGLAKIFESGDLGGNVGAAS